MLIEPIISGLKTHILDTGPKLDEFRLQVPVDAVVTYLQHRAIPGGQLDDWLLAALVRVFPPADNRRSCCPRR